MKLVAGSYERFLWGWRLRKKKQQQQQKRAGKPKEEDEEGGEVAAAADDDEEEGEEDGGGGGGGGAGEGEGEGGGKTGKRCEELHQIFSYPAHLGPIKCIASMGPVMATGGADDTIKVFDANAQKDMGTLIQHTGAVSCLAFFGHGGLPSPYPSNLLSGSEDGTVCVWNTEAWILYKTMKGHKGGVSDLSIHPSGRICLSVGRDSQLNMYDLLKGRRSFTTKLKNEGSLIRFSPEEGLFYSLCVENDVIVHGSEDGRPLCTFSHEKRVLCMAQEEDKMLYTAGEECAIRAWDTRSARAALYIEKAHGNRIRGLATWGTSEDASSSSSYVASASSDGYVRVWDARYVAKSNISISSKPLMEAATKARLTCLTACSIRRRLQKTPGMEGVISLNEGQTLPSLDSHTSDSLKRDAVKGSSDIKSLKKKEKKKKKKKIKSDETKEC